AEDGDAAASGGEIEKSFQRGLHRGGVGVVGIVEEGDRAEVFDLEAHVGTGGVGERFDDQFFAEADAAGDGDGGQGVGGGVAAEKRDEDVAAAVEFEFQAVRVADNV